MSPGTHTIGDHQPTFDGPFGDVRDRLSLLPVHGGGYWSTDLFTVKHELLAAEYADARSIFEIGALVGEFLVTALDACPDADRVGWVDSEVHTPGSNVLCGENIRAAFPGEDHARRHWTHVRELPYGRLPQYDVVQVDGEHSMHACIADLTVAYGLRPSVILVDDYGVIAAVREAVDLWAGYMGFDVQELVSINGTAVIRP